MISLSLCRWFRPFLVLQINEAACVFRTLYNQDLRSTDPYAAPPVVYFFVGKNVGIPQPSPGPNTQTFDPSPAGTEWDHEKPYWNGFMMYEQFDRSLALKMAGNCKTTTQK